MSEAKETCQTAHLSYSSPSNDTLFHAVYIPNDNSELCTQSNASDNVRIYLDKAEALKVIKEHKTGRFKTFKKRADAEEYAKTGHEQIYSNNALSTQTAPAVEEKSSNFKAPRSQELVCLRKLIENGDIEDVKNIVWGNPRYLISSGDTPAILQEGCRYNALHIAVKASRADMCDLILTTVGDTTFIQLLYGEEEGSNYLDRAQIMLDLYLNTPDKGLNETPLHFAAKFGLKDVVCVLVSYSQCIKTLSNKYKQMPVDIICSRKCQDDEQLKKDIRMLLEDYYYVPVLRSEGNTLQPVIGEPFSPTEPLHLNIDPISPRVEVRAFAGPMSKSQALEFRKKWKTPPRICRSPMKRDMNNDTDSTSVHGTSTPSNYALRLQDTEKGLEYVGRNLAEEYHIPWKEHWPFLDDFADFRCTKGLAKLERYLEQRYSTQALNCKKENKNLNITRKLEETDDINDLCNKLKSCDLGDDTPNCQDDTSLANEDLMGEIDDWDDLEFFTPPSSPILTRHNSEEEMCIAEEGCVMFIEGAVPTKADYAVYNALPDTINSDTHPNIYRWRHEVELAMRRKVFRFNNTGLAKRKLVMDE